MGLPENEIILSGSISGMIGKIINIAFGHSGRFSKTQDNRFAKILVNIIKISKKMIPFNDKTSHLGEFIDEATSLNADEIIVEVDDNVPQKDIGHIEALAITFPDSATFAFDGFIAKFTGSLIKIKITGEPTFTT